MKVLVLNCGSSSVKFQLIESSTELMKQDKEVLLATGLIEKIGLSSSIVKYKPTGKEPVTETPSILEHTVAIEKVVKLLTHPEYGVIKDQKEIDAVGHRVVHGGEKFSGSKIITDEIYKEIVECVELAPLHNPHNIKGYQISRQLLPDIPHVAVFDTAFHQTMPSFAYVYGLPYVLYKRHAVRRYGFHGTSHRYLTSYLAKYHNKPVESFNVITVHIGNGCSIAAVKGGKSVDTSMGFTPLEGLIMGTRCGDIDPAIVLHIMAKEELGLHEANTMMNKHSGLLGISGVSSDMREVVKEAEKGNDRAKLAIDVYCYRIRKYIGSYAAALGGVDYIAFTAGVGENSPLIREKSCEGLEFMSAKIDPAKNNACIGKFADISTEDSKTKIYAIPTNEEIVIARDTVELVEQLKK